MILYPAIDLKEGACVRLALGDMARATVYNPDPADQARAFAAAGARWLHVVDLDGAFAGQARNGVAVAAILAAAPGLKVQLGGGIRDRRAIDAWLDKGVARVVLGTAALTDSALVKAAARDHPGRILVAVDARDDRVAVEGWTRASAHSAVDLARRFEDAGVAALLYTDIGRDGMLAGLNVATTRALAQATGLPVIASGGLAGLADLEALKAAARDLPPGAIDGVIAGRALYDGRLELREALAALAA
ncbi:MAG: 1-(5-phosphoribosyl)-5-[(5-phosphoribosylamino)methylideneamino]imidazole-4-carboxamide isomerase [Pseudomonadota bacterium]